MQSLETETEILQDRDWDETWDLRDRDRDSKKRVSRLHHWFWPLFCRWFGYYFAL